MHTERHGHYEVELSARQLIHNGGWAAFAAIHTAEDTDDAAAAVFPRQWVLDETVFESEAAAIVGAREAALALLKRGNSPSLGMS
ncbi:hypothetical protein [Paraburkholderia lycopersici]|uniref:Uncharacterized protein n=1 Tax=Paraburkholderia lycopersici TaxID=416944 RepID=A0A1G6L6E7_9BURK|nr:hypothetical protein [Paraburkholderia lycopersici]SDC38859.1 hypothetical protein SAMN05421548_106128 [Paraburkholderia lycopersici]